MSSHQDIDQVVHDYIYSQFPLARRQKIDADASLLEGGIVDSLGILDIVSFIETEFSVTLTDEELLSGNFESIRSLSEFLKQKVAQQQPV